MKYDQNHPHRLSDDNQKGPRVVIAHSEEGDIAADSQPGVFRILLIEIFQLVSVKIVMETLLKRQKLEG